jgi:hypothetical protein
VNKHYLLAIAITPMLLIAGYMAAGHFFAKSNDEMVYQLEANKDCNISVGGGCILQNGELIITLKVKADRIIAESSHELVKVNIGFGKQTLLMKKENSAKHWIVLHDMSKQVPHNVRYVAQSESGFFIAEITP